MERSTSVNPGSGEQNLTPGEQKILTLMEQGQQRLEKGQQLTNQRLQSLEDGQQRTNQRLHSLENKLSDHGEQLRILTGRVAQEGAASKQRDRELAEEIRRFREAREQKDQETVAWISQAKQEAISSLSRETNTLRADHDRLLDQHNTRLEMLEQSANLRETGENPQSLQALSEEVKKLAARLELKADVSRVEALEQRLGE
jgi:uncharacterized phage infection (PIP) family protein YhgE